MANDGPHCTHQLNLADIFLTIRAFTSGTIRDLNNHRHHFKLNIDECQSSFAH